MKVRIELEVNEYELRLLQTHSLERVLHTLSKARTRADLQSVQYDAAVLEPVASRLWYAASGAEVVE